MKHAKKMPSDKKIKLSILRLKARVDASELTLPQLRMVAKTYQEELERRTK